MSRSFYTRQQGVSCRLTKENPSSEGVAWTTDQLSLVLVALPDTGTERLADAKADANGNADDQQANHDLDDDAVSFAHCCQTVAGMTVHLSILRFLLPVVLAGPNRAICCRGPLCQRVLFDAGFVGDHGFDVGLERVGTNAGRDV